MLMVFFISLIERLDEDFVKEDSSKATGFRNGNNEPIEVVAAFFFRMKMNHLQLFVHLFAGSVLPLMPFLHYCSWALKCIKNLIFLVQTSHVSLQYSFSVFHPISNFLMLWSNGTGNSVLLRVLISECDKLSVTDK